MGGAKGGATRLTSHLHRRARAGKSSSSEGSGEGKQEKPGKGQLQGLGQHSLSAANCSRKAAHTGCWKI